MTTTALRIVLADDAVLLREALATSLASAGFEVVGQAADVEGLLALVSSTVPDVVVVDVRMPPTHTTEGLEAARQIRLRYPGTAILVLSQYVETRYALELLLSPRGLLIVTPIVVMGLLGTVLMWRRGRRAEASVIGAIVAAYFVYDAGYWLPMGGGSPGPRFLIPTLPFLALGIAYAWRRWPGPTMALAVPSAITMIAAATTYPLITFGHTGDWSQRASDANFQHTVLSLFGLDNGWVATAPVLIAFLAAAILAWRSAPSLRVGWSGWPVLAAWGLVAYYLAPRVGETVIAGRVVGPVGIVDHRGHGTLVIWALIATAVSLAAASWRSAKVVDDEVPVDAPRDPERRHRTGTPVLPGRSRQPVGVQYDSPEPETT